MDLTLALQRFDNFFTQHGFAGLVHNTQLLTQALTHKSYAADMPSKQIPFNERIEFLGDAVLGMVIADQLYRDYPALAESDLTLKKIYLIKEQTLATAARKIGAGAWIRLGKGEERSGGEQKDVVLADLFESLIAYLRLQFGLEVSRIFIIELLYPYRDDADALRGKSYKSLLQEFIQKHYQTLPVYVEEEVEVESSGNVLSYRSTVMLGEKLLGTGLAQNKRKAQEEAAQQAYTSLATSN